MNIFKNILLLYELYYYMNYYMNIFMNILSLSLCSIQQERPAVADKPARRLQNVCTVYVRAVVL